MSKKKTKEDLYQHTWLKNLHYDVWLEWTINNACNLHCAYCWFNLGEDGYLAKESIPEGISSFFYAKGSNKINLALLRKALNRADKVFRISLTGGEPFLLSNIIDVCFEITKKHFFSTNSNLISDKIKDFSERIDPKRVVFINASCHIKELERLNLLKIYINNFYLCKKKGFNIGASEPAYPPILDEVSKYREFFKKIGIGFRFVKFCGKYNGKMYPDAYTKEELEIFGIENDPDIKMFHSKGKLCNAGYNVCVVAPDGSAIPCARISENLGNIFDKINFKKELMKCPHELCGCPLKCYDPYLFDKALVGCGTKPALEKS
ncbi:MAG: hypothetical protein NTZ63_05570 [Candidatus Omnitrophica bacterium]|nr:hypothetical protein [Candidatus Omnitrophota bacterium]